MLSTRTILRFDRNRLRSSLSCLRAVLGFFTSGTYMGIERQINFSLIYLFKNVVQSLNKSIALVSSKHWRGRFGNFSQVLQGSSF